MLVYSITPNKITERKTIQLHFIERSREQSQVYCFPLVSEFNGSIVAKEPFKVSSRSAIRALGGFHVQLSINN